MSLDIGVQYLQEPNTLAGNWLKNTGGLAPIASNAIVECRHRDGTTTKGVAIGYASLWNNPELDKYIVDFRFVGTFKSFDLSAVSLRSALTNAYVRLRQEPIDSDELIKTRAELCLLIERFVNRLEEKQNGNDNKATI